MATAAKAAPAAAAEAAPAPKKSKKLLVIVIALVVVLLAGGGAGAWWFMSKQDDESAENEGSKKKKKKAKAPSTFVDVQPFFTVNLTGEDSERYLQLGVVFELTDAKAQETLKAKMPAIRSEVLLLLSEQKAKQLLSAEGKKSVADAILGIARKRLDTDEDGPLEAVHFSVFVIQ